MWLEPLPWMIALAMLIGALANSVSGIGFGLVCAPLLALVMDPRQAAALTVLMSCPNSAVVLLHDRRSVRPRDAALILIPGILTAPVWALALARVDQTNLARAAGGTVLLSVALLAFGFRSQRLTGTAGAVIAGAAASGMTLMAAVGGPPVALYALNVGWDASRTRATIQAIFLPLGVVALIALRVPPWQSSIYVPAVVGLALGLAAGVPAARHVGPRIARSVTLLLAAASATALLFAA